MERNVKGIDEWGLDYELKLGLEAVDLGDLDALEEDIVPCTGCGCSNCDAK
jgi:hypothetical protein